MDGSTMLVGGLWRPAGGTGKTGNLIDKAMLDRMRPTAVVVNCGRGGLLDLDAALDALTAGRLGGVGLDIPAIDTLVVTDLVPDRVKRVVDRYGADGVDSLEALLAAGVDGVVIAASTNAHTSLVLSCVEAGLPPLCEKPVAPSGTDAGAVRGRAGRPRTGRWRRVWRRSGGCGC